MKRMLTAALTATAFASAAAADDDGPRYGDPIERFLGSIFESVGDEDDDRGYHGGRFWPHGHADRDDDDDDGGWRSDDDDD